MATRMTSARFVGRTASSPSSRAAPRRDAAERVRRSRWSRGESGVGKSRLAGRAGPARAREAGARVLCGRLRRARRGRAALRPAARRPAAAGARTAIPALDALPASRSAPLSTRCCPALGGGAADEARGQQSAVFEAPAGAARGARRGAAGAAGDRGPALGRQLHARRSSPSWRGRCAASALLVVGTYRSDELHRRHPLRPLLAELARDPSRALIELPALHARGDGASSSRASSAARPTPGSWSALYTRSEGNAAVHRGDPRGRPRRPRRAAADPARRADAARRAALAGRTGGAALARLPAAPPTRRSLDAVAGLEPGELREALREAVASQIVVILPDGGYGFRHALLREVVYDDLLPGERTAMHAALGAGARGHGSTPATPAPTSPRRRRTTGTAAGDQPAALAASVRAAARRRAGERLRARRTRCSSARSSCGSACPTPRRLAGAQPASTCWSAPPSPRTPPASPARQEALLRHAPQLVDENEEPRRRGRAAATR